MDNRSDEVKMVCANCGNDYFEGDKYCRYCGAPMGKPKFVNIVYSILYGPNPPIVRTHTCSKCGFTWDTDLIFDDQLYCPKCGSKAPVTYEEDW